MKVRRIHILLVLLALAVCLIPFRARVKSTVVSVIQILKGRKSIEDRVAEFGEAVHGRLKPRFAEIGVVYPPKRVVLVGLKQERMLEVWVAGGSGELRYLHSYPILAASGTLGPKLAEGDFQVPEGLYRIESLNPNSLYHLALRVNYPNSFDKTKGLADGRTNLGSDIMIHGKAASIGCLAMGDSAAEDLFVLAAETGTANIQVILSPVDFRTQQLPADRPPLPPWTEELYLEIQRELLKLPKPPDGPKNANLPSGSGAIAKARAAGFDLCRVRSALTVPNQITEPSFEQLVIGSAAWKSPPPVSGRILTSSVFATHSQ
jgi:hypothetical protein